MQENKELTVAARIATKDDAPAVVDLWKRFMTETKMVVEKKPEDINKEARRWSKRVARMIEEKKSFVVEYNKKITGFACYIGGVKEVAQKQDRTHRASTQKPPGRKHPIPLGVAYITDFYVSPEARKSRAAQNLMAVMSEAIEKTGYKAIWTNTSSRNRRVHILLGRLGFSVMTDFKLSGKENHVYYKKRLNM